MVLGIGEGSIEIVLDEGQLFEPGKTIKGKVRLDLKERKKAKGLRIKFYGEIKKRVHGRGRREEEIERIHERIFTIGEEKEYPAGVTEYEWQIELPSVKAREPGKDMFGKVFDFLAPDPLLKVKWYLDASLELPMAFDINKKMQISFNI